MTECAWEKDPKHGKRGCGEPHPRCGGHNKAGRPCMAMPANGTGYCRQAHGGAAPQTVAKAKVRAATEKARRMLDTYGVLSADELRSRPNLDPLAVLAAELKARSAQVEWLREKVASLSADQLIQESQAGLETLGVWLQAKDAAEDRLTALALAMQKAGLEERVVRVEEAKVELLFEVMGRVLAALGHDLGDPAVAQIVDGELAALEAA